MEAVEPPPRHTGEDAVRLIGLLAVLVSQVWSLAPVIRWTSWAVPLFFLIGGYYWFATRTLRDDLKRWFLSIGQPYLFWWVVAAAVFAGWEWFRGGSVPTKVLGLAAWGGIGSGRPWTGFWIVAACFIAMVVVLISMRAGWWWTLAFAYAGLVISHVEPDFAKLAPLAAIAAMACTGFVVLGIGLRELRVRLPRPGLVGISAVVLGFAGILLPGYRPVDIQAADFGTPGLSILVVSLIGSGLILVGSAVQLPPSLGRTFAALARCNVAVLLSFGIVLFLLGTSDDGGWLDFTLALLIPMGFALLTLRSRWAPWIHGVQEFSYRGSSHKRFRGAMF
jgi:hypothetical protein